MEPLSYRNQSIDLPCKTMNWFLYDNGLRHERVNLNFSLKFALNSFMTGVLYRNECIDFNCIVKVSKFLYFCVKKKIEKKKVEKLYLERKNKHGK